MNLRRHHALSLIMMLLGLLLLPACSGVGMHEPGSLAYGDRYRVQELQGWQVHVSTDLVNRDPKLAKLTIYHLDQQLEQIALRLPEHSLPTLKKVPIWVELEQGDRHMLFYHSSRKDLVRQGVDQFKYRGIEITNARTFINWSNRHQWMMLHEMCHAWHHQVVGFEDPRVYRTWRAALDEGKYYRVVGGGGFYGRAYATKNEYEYFAEICEAYFSRNDYFPYTRDDLRLYDPKGFLLVQQLWGIR